MRSGERRAVPAQLLAMARQAAAPGLTDPALNRRFGPRSTWTPAPGQIWRSVHGEVTALVLLLEAEAAAVTVVPLSLEPEEQPAREDAEAVLLDSSATALGLPVVVWTGLRRRLPAGVLDRPIDVVGTGVLQQAAVRPRPGHTRPGSVLAPAASAHADARAAVEDDLDILADAAMAEPATADSDRTGSATTLDWRNLDPVALKEAATRLGVALPAVLELIDGKRPATPAQGAVLREVLGAAPANAAPPPAGLVVELTQPRWRGLVRGRSSRDRLTEAAARTALAYDVIGMAARQTGGQEPAWPDRVRRWAEAHHLDPDADL